MHWSWMATILLGLGQVTGIVVEWAYVGMSPLLVIYGAVGMALTCARGGCRHRSRSARPTSRIPRRSPVGWRSTNLLSSSCPTPSVASTSPHASERTLTSRNAELLTVGQRQAAATEAHLGRLRTCLKGLKLKVQPAVAEDVPPTSGEVRGPATVGGTDRWRCFRGAEVADPQGRGEEADRVDGHGDGRAKPGDEQAPGRWPDTGGGPERCLEPAVRLWCANVVRAMATGRELGLVAWGMTGPAPNDLSQLCDEPNVGPAPAPPVATSPPGGPSYTRLAVTDEHDDLAGTLTARRSPRRSGRNRRPRS